MKLLHKGAMIGLQIICQEIALLNLRNRDDPSLVPELFGLGTQLFFFIPIVELATLRTPRTLVGSKSGQSRNTRE